MSSDQRSRVRAYSSLAEAAEAADALTAVGIPRERVQVRVAVDEAGPVEGNFVIGNGQTTHGGPPKAVRTGGEVPYDENFRNTVRRGNYLLLLDQLDLEELAKAEALLDQIGSSAGKPGL